MRRRVELGGGAGGEDAEDEELLRLVGHRPLVEDGEMADDLAVGVAQRDAEIALDAHLDERLVAWEFLGDAGRMVAEFALDHVFAGRAVEIVLDVGDDAIFRPEGERADAGFAAGELGDEDVLNVDGRGQMLARAN